MSKTSVWKSQSLQQRGKTLSINRLHDSHSMTLPCDDIRFANLHLTMSWESQCLLCCLFGDYWTGVTYLRNSRHFQIPSESLQLQAELSTNRLSIFRLCLIILESFWLCLQSLLSLLHYLTATFWKWKSFGPWNNSLRDPSLIMISVCCCICARVSCVDVSVILVTETGLKTSCCHHHASCVITK